MEKLTQNSDIRKWFKRYKFHITAEKLEVVTEENSTAGQVEEARQKNLATLIDHLDHEIYDILEDQCYPETVESRTTEQVQKLLEDFIDPKPSKHWQRYVFDKLYQKEGQSVKEFIKEIRRTGSLCEFGNYSNDAMLTKLLSGLKNEKLVSEMLGDPDVMWESAQAKALSTEKTLQEAQKMKSSSGISPATIKALRLIFARTGLPMTLVSDNGPSLVSYEMKNFLKQNGIKHIPIPTYSSKSNGICERFVGTFKAAMKKMCETDSDVDKNVANFLLTYRNTPHSSTGEAPAVRAFNRNLRFCLTQIRPTDSQKVKDLHPEQERKVMMKNERSFEPKQPVYVQLDMDKTWTPAVIKQRHGSNSNVYDIECNGRVIKKHGDKLKARDMSISVTKKQMQPEEMELMRRQLAAKESKQSSGTSSGTSEPIETKSIPSPAQVSMPESRPNRAAKTDALAKIKSTFQR